ncbi:MAG TPA: VOC family protein [Novosphingobium sp.]|nr:VOC family protein [Novosphingobium sp.]
MMAPALTVPTTERNLTGARIAVFTIVTPDLAASIDFYTRFMNYALAERGVLPPGTIVEEADLSGRAYAILRHDGAVQGQLRFVEAAQGARPNRPRPGSHAWDRGFGAIECMTRDIEESYQQMVRAGVETLSPPAYYFYRDMRRLNGSTLYPKSLDTLTYVPVGPAGELIYISVVLPDNFGLPFPHLHSACHNCFVVHPSRAPVLDFYNAVFGLLPIAEYTGTLSCQRAINRLLGESEDSLLWAGGMGDDFGMEFMEWTPAQGHETQFLPQSLARTGHAMVTIAVNDLAAVARRIEAAGLAPLAARPLPMVGQALPAGILLRGASGELVEVVERSVL